MAIKGNSFLNRTAHLAGYVLIPVLLLAGWQFLSSFGVIRPMILPSPAQVAEVFWQLVESGELAKHVGSSALRVVEGFALAAAGGLALGVGAGIFRGFGRLVELPIQLIKPIPPIAWIPLAILWFGIGEGAKVYIIFIGAFFPILINTIDGIRQTDVRFVELARILEVPRWRFIRQVILPGALPQIMTGLRIGLNIAWMCVVAAELIAASSGIGFLIMDARLLSQTDIVLAGMITMGFLGKVTDDLLQKLETRLVTWRNAFSGH
ncbi:MAG TPA: ABC transporter permease [Rhodocyclaceae bacterium]|nr:ABC transporter permease [Rhodocyclaceae bacterium]